MILDLFKILCAKFLTFDILNKYRRFSLKNRNLSKKPESKAAVLTNFQSLEHKPSRPTVKLQGRMPSLSSMKYAKSMGELNSITDHQHSNTNNRNLITNNQNHYFDTNYTQNTSPFFSKNKLYSSCFMNEITHLESYFGIANNMNENNNNNNSNVNCNKHRQFISQNNYMNSEQFIRPVKNLCNISHNEPNNIYENNNYIESFKEYQNVPQVNMTTSFIYD